MGYIKLHPQDAEKYGAPPEIPFDLTAIGVRQRAAVEAASKRSLRWMFDQLAGVPELDEHGNTIPAPVIDPETREQKIGEDGEPVFTERLTRHGDAIAMVAWMALWGIGIKPAWDAFDPIESGLIVRADDDEAVSDPGKAEEPEADSASTTNSQD